MIGGPSRMAGTAPHGWEMGRMDDITFVDLDVHKASLCVAVAKGAVAICVGICLAWSPVG